MSRRAAQTIMVPLAAAIVINIAVGSASALPLRQTMDVCGKEPYSCIFSK